MASAPQTISTDRNILPLLPHKSFLDTLAMEGACSLLLTQHKASSWHCEITTALKFRCFLSGRNWSNIPCKPRRLQGKKQHRLLQQSGSAAGSVLTFLRRRAGRSSAFPSSLASYASFTMMLRAVRYDAFARSQSFGSQDKPSQGATDSKRFWIYSGESWHGLCGRRSPSETLLRRGTSFGTSPDQQWADDSMPFARPPDTLPRARFLVSCQMFRLSV
jgi:hypothetical protein